MGQEIFIEVPVILPVSGCYRPNQEISMTCSTAGALIYYTEDGSIPDVNSTLYTVPFQLALDKAIKAIGIIPYVFDQAGEILYDVEPEIHYDTSSGIAVETYTLVSQYRFVFTGLQGGSSQPEIAISELQLSLSKDGEDVTGIEPNTLTAYDDSGPLYEVGNLINDDPNTFWKAPSNPTLLSTDGVWVELEFDDRVDAVEYSFTAAAVPDETPIDWKVEKGRGSEYWTTKHEETPANWNSYENKKFPIPQSSPLYYKTLMQ